MKTSDQTDAPEIWITQGDAAQSSRPSLTPVAEKSLSPPSNRPHWSLRLKPSNPAEISPDNFLGTFQEVFRHEPFNIVNGSIRWPAQVEGNAEPADVDALLSYLEAVLVSLEQHTVPVIIAWPDPREAPLLIAGETLKQHLDRVLRVLKRLREPHRQQAAVKLASVIQHHYRAWLELVEHWKGEFPGLLPLHGFYPDYVYPPTYYRAVPDTGVTDFPFDRWTRSRISAEMDLRWRHDCGPRPGIISITTHHAVGPCRDTGFSGEIDGGICCEHMIAAARNEDSPETTSDTGEYFIDSITQIHCSAPYMNWPEDINDVMFAEMPDDATWTPEVLDVEPTGFPNEHLDDGWWARQLRFCLREALPLNE